MHQTKKCQQWHSAAAPALPRLRHPYRLEMKAHIGVDERTGLVHTGLAAARKARCSAEGACAFPSCLAQSHSEVAERR